MFFSFRPLGGKKPSSYSGILPHTRAPHTPAEAVGMIMVLNKNNDAAMELWWVEDYTTGLETIKRFYAEMSDWDCEFFSLPLPIKL